MTDTTKPNGDRDRQDLGVQYHVLPDDPLAAPNILREAAGLEPLSNEDDPAWRERIRRAEQHPGDDAGAGSVEEVQHADLHPARPHGASAGQRHRVVGDRGPPRPAFLTASGAQPERSS